MKWISFILLVGISFCQVPVSLAPEVHPQFLNSQGKPLSNGFLFTYDAGTSNLRNTYLDSAGTIANPDPIPLDASGAPTNGSMQTQIWLANQTYKFCAYDSHFVQQWCSDNIASNSVLSSFSVTNPGIFTDTQVHQYVKSAVGSGGFSTYGQGGTTEAGTFSMAIPSNAVVLEGDSLVGLVQSNCNSSGRSVCNGVALSGHAWANAVGSAVWGQNVTVQDTPGATAANLVGMEVDVGLGQNQSSGWVHGLDIFLSPSVNLTGTMPSGTNGSAMTIGKTNGLGISWSNGIYIQPSSTSEAAISIGSACTAGPCSSQIVALAGLDPGSVPHFGTWSVDSMGNIVLTAATGLGVKLPQSSFSSLSGAASNGTILYCTDCKNIPDNSVAAGAACAGGGAGAFAKRENNRWDCN